jgi:hypothetical protein
MGKQNRVETKLCEITDALWVQNSHQVIALVLNHFGVKATGSSLYALALLIQTSVLNVLPSGHNGS